MLRNLLPKRLRRALGAIRDVSVTHFYVAKAMRRLNHPRAGRPHGLPGELMISLTSYPARFATLHLTLACLLDQSAKADRTILWIAHDDIEKLPAAITELKGRGLEIRACEDLRSYKKLVPALEAFPNAFIATADDDVYYPRDWLNALVAGIKTSPRTIACHRAHRITRESSGRVAPYLDWDFDVQDDAARRPSTDLLPTGVGGVIYPPGSLDRRATDRSLFQRLSRHGDDLWFYWCAHMTGTRHQKVGTRFHQIVWPETQSSSLWERNEAGRNDLMIEALERELGSTDGILRHD